MKIVFFVSEDKNLGIGYLSSYLKAHGHETHLLFDPRQFAKSYVRQARLAGHFSKKRYFLKQIRKIKPDLIGFSVVTANYQWALELARTVKQFFMTPIIFGGVHPTLVPERVIKEEAVDMVCVGEAEEALLELVENLGSSTSIKNIYFKKNQGVVVNPLRPLQQDLDKYPFPDEEMFYEVLPPSYRTTSSIMTSRGCPFSCTYCSNQGVATLYKGQRYVRRRSVQNVLAELSWRKHRFRTRHFVFMDDIFASDARWLEEFIPQYKKHIGLPFNCLAHPSLVNDKIIGLLKEGGCTTIDFGLQSGSERLRRQVLLRSETNENVTGAVTACKKHKVHFAIDQILNIPHETEKDVLDSLEFLNNLRPDIVNCFSLLYFPKAAIIEKAREAGLLNDDDLAKIEEGLDSSLYSTASVSFDSSKQLSFYRKYAMLFCALPLLPKRAALRIIHSEKLLNLFSRIPFSLLPFIKVIVDFKGGLGFIPLAVIKNELFYIRQHFRYQRYLKKT